MNRKQSRRSFLTASAAAAAAWHVNPGAVCASRSPLEKLNIAAIGTGNRAGADIDGCASQNIVALADVDSGMLAKAKSEYGAERTYTDFRVMLEKEAERIDAVIIGTPDHTHAPAAAMAMRMGKHVYCEKPLTHTVYEARTLAKLAAENKLVTQMGTQIHAGDNYRRVVELIQSGTIGAVREVHVWVGVDYSGAKLTRGHEAPSSVNWDLWLGPAPQSDYVECTINGKPETVHPFHWRWFWNYGTGGLGDFGCHYMDLAHWALKLRNPVNVAARGPAVDRHATTSGLTVLYEYPARGDMPPVSLTWYDGGKKPPVLANYTGADGKPLTQESGQLFIGERGAVISNYGSHQLLPNDGEELQRPDPWIPESIGHHNEWIDAVRNGGTTTCNFEYSGALTESVLLGVVSYRSGEPLVWDSQQLQVTNSAGAQQLIHKEYRRGWTL